MRLVYVSSRIKNGRAVDSNIKDQRMVKDAHETLNSSSTVLLYITEGRRVGRMSKEKVNCSYI